MRGVWRMEDGEPSSAVATAAEETRRPGSDDVTAAKIVAAVGPTGGLTLTTHT